MMSIQIFCQTQLPEHFLDGKAVILISNAPDARPIMQWKAIAREVHPALVEAGGDPVAYYELEELILSEEIQRAYATIFSQRLIRNILILTRKSNGDFYINILEYSGNESIVSAGSSWTMEANDIQILKERVVAAGKGMRSKNLMALDVPTFLPPLVGGAEGASTAPANNNAISGRFVAENPLNLDIFKLGIPLSGASGENALLTRYRYDLYGKSNDEVLAAQKAEKANLERIFDQYYEHQTVFLTEIRSDKQLISDRIQFVLTRVEGREADLMESMGLDPASLENTDRIVVKYYIKFLVRNELYIGPKWDADPNGQTALINFLKNLKIEP
ncbi:NTPase [Echinicola strongylocentroti]|nr:NTPase [Echinicola strongylocentroti]